MDEEVKKILDIIKSGPKYDTQPKKYTKRPLIVEAYQTDKELYIDTLEGTMKADIGDYIITGIHGEKYPRKPIRELLFDEFNKRGAA